MPLNLIDGSQLMHYRGKYLPEISNYRITNKKELRALKYFNLSGVKNQNLEYKLYNSLV